MLSASMLPVMSVNVILMFVMLPAMVVDVYLLNKTCQCLARCCFCSA